MPHHSYLVRMKSCQIKPHHPFPRPSIMLKFHLRIFPDHAAFLPSSSAGNLLTMEPITLHSKMAESTAGSSLPRKSHTQTTVACSWFSIQMISNPPWQKPSASEHPSPNKSSPSPAAADFNSPSQAAASFQCGQISKKQPTNSKNEIINYLSLLFSILLCYSS